MTNLETNSELTQADREALQRLPSGDWFRIHQVSYMVRNPRWRCDRLTEKGVLESRVVSTPNGPGFATGFSYHTEYRKVLNSALSETPSKTRE